MDELTIPEYNLLMQSVQLRQVDEQYRLHWQAYLNQAVKSTKGKKNPKPLYPRFSKFFDYEKAQQAVMNNEKKDARTDRFAALRAHLREEGKTDA